MKKEEEITQIDLINKNLEACKPSSEDQDLIKEEAIAFSSKIINILKSKEKDFNRKNKNKIDFLDLKRIFCRACGLETETKTKVEVALANVNMFIRFSSGTIDITKGISPSEEDYSLALEEIKKDNLNFNFNSVEDLYINEKASKAFWFDL